jgi:hypothetical protein
MKDLTLSQIFEEAFDRARDLDAPLGARLESITESVRMANPAFAEAQDRLYHAAALKWLRRHGSRCRRSDAAIHAAG